MKKAVRWIRSGELGVGWKLGDWQRGGFCWDKCCLRLNESVGRKWGGSRSKGVVVRVVVKVVAKK